MRGLIFIGIVLFILLGFIIYVKGWDDGFDDGEMFEKDKHQTPYLDDLIDEEEA